MNIEQSAIDIVNCNKSFIIITIIIQDAQFVVTNNNNNNKQTKIGQLVYNHPFMIRINVDQLT